MSLLARLVRKITALPLYVHFLVLGVSLFVLFAGVNHYVQRHKAEKEALASMNQQQRWCREFAVRTDCSIASHNNIQCPYKKLSNTFKVINIEQCKEFSEEYALLKTAYSKAADGRPTEDIDPVSRMRERIRSKPFVDKPE